MVELLVDNLLLHYKVEKKTYKVVTVVTTL